MAGWVSVSANVFFVFFALGCCSGRQLECFGVRLAFNLRVTFTTKPLFLLARGDFFRAFHFFDY